MGCCCFGLGLLLWKNFILLRRKWILTILEVVMPCLAVVLMVAIKQATPAGTQMNATVYDSFATNTFPYYLKPPSNKNPKATFSLFPWYIAYTPVNADTQAIISMVLNDLPTIKSSLSFSSESDMETYFKNTNNSNLPYGLAGIVFVNNLQSGDNKLNYKLRFPFQIRNSTKATSASATDYWKTGLNYPVRSSTGPRESNDSTGGVPGYYREGFLTLQASIDRALIAYVNNYRSNSSAVSLLNEVSVQLQRMPYPPYFNDRFLSAIQPQLPILLIMAFLFLVVDITNSVVYEKEKKLKESLKMMGISSMTHWFAWFITYLAIMTISVIIMVIFFCAKFPPTGSILPLTSPILVFIFLELYVITVITFSFLMTVFFDSASSAAAVAGIVFFLTYIPYTFINQNYSTIKSSAVTASCVAPNIGMSLGINLICSFELQGVGLQAKNIATGLNVDDTFTMAQVWLIFIIMSFIFWFIAYYVEQVFPGEYGVPRPWYFFFTKSFWCNCCCGGNENPQVDNYNYPTDRQNYFQEEPINVDAGIQIRQLTKVFGSGRSKQTAVNNLNMNMYRGNITVLLGHNGAGKTTTMSVLTGFIPPTSGTVYVDGLDIRQDLETVRRRLGLCPQHDILYDKLTVQEHLIFFAKLKGLEGNQLKEEVEDIIARVNLKNKRDVFSMNLSGGMRRRLSIAMALVGGTQIVILDEPTSGLDPHARRELWTLLQKERANRTMLLSTHFMDEAEILGDRIAIMAKGQLLCCGTPLFLKNCYGADYRLTLVKTEKFNMNAVQSLVSRHVPQCRIESNISDDLTFLLPTSASKSFQALFTELENQMAQLGIRSFGASITNMEEVFLKAENYHDNVDNEEENGHQAEVNVDQTETYTDVNVLPTIHNRVHPEDDNPKHVAPGPVACNTGVRLFFQQFRHLLLKKWLIFLQHKLLALAQMLVPAAFVALGLGIIKLSPSASNSPSLGLTLDAFKTIVTVYDSRLLTTTNAQHQALVTSFANLFTTRSSSTVVNHSDVNQDFAAYLVSQGEKDVFNYNRQYALGATFQTISTSKTNFTAFFNNDAYHTPGILQNYISNALLQATGATSYSISTTNHPLPMNDNDQISVLTGKEVSGYSLAIFLIFGLSFLVSTFASPVIAERISRAKQLQYLSGCTSGAYWLSTYLWDLFNFFIPSLLLVIIFAIFQEDAFVGNARFLLTFLLLMDFGFAIIPMMYLLSLLFTIPSDGISWLTRINILLGLASFIAVNVLKIPALDVESVGLALEWVFYIILPQFSIGQGIYNMFVNNLYVKACATVNCQYVITSSPCCDCTSDCANDNYLSWNTLGIGRPLIFMAIQAFVFTIILFILESSSFEALRSRLCSRVNKETREQDSLDLMENEDSDVLEERKNIYAADLEKLKESKCLILRDLSKIFGSFRAVDGLTCAISPGTCFGLLGINGAGKTTTFSMMTGDLSPTSGEIYVNGFNLAKNSREAQKTIGYCPQYNALIDEMTARQQLTFYCNLRGFNPDEIPAEVERLMDFLNLTNYADAVSGRYSGGNKRKLNTAIALVGNPPLVFLDEPTTGMDPGARRQLWNTLTKYRNAGNTLVLTSHSMEECEALCTKVVIMVNGRFQCLGSTQLLKTKFAEGYTVLVQIPYPSEQQGNENINGLLTFLKSNAGEFEVKDQHQGHIHLYFKKSSNLTWSRLFNLFESNRESLHIEHYSVSQTSLEQVFLGFAKNQMPPRKAPPLCKCCGSCCRNKGDEDDEEEQNNGE